MAALRVGCAGVAALAGVSLGTALGAGCSASALHAEDVAIDPPAKESRIVKRAMELRDELVSMGFFMKEEYGMNSDSTQELWTKPERHGRLDRIGRNWMRTSRLCYIEILLLNMANGSIGGHRTFTAIVGCRTLALL